MLALSGASLVLPDRIIAGGTLIIEQGRIAEIRAASTRASQSALHKHYIVPGFIDVHVHGVGGFDSLDEGEAIASIAAQLPRYGVTAFCPTTVACSPAALRRTLDQVRRLREAPQQGSARVLPAHLESSFINPEYRGAQPLSCLRNPREATRPPAAQATPVSSEETDSVFTAADILHEIERAQTDVGIVTLAPELEGGLDLVRRLTSRGCRVSLGHSAATYEQGLAAIEAGARHAAHLFNRMPAFHHRKPGLVGAILHSQEVAAEVIADGVHVHPAVIRAAVAAKQPSGVMAITDGTAASGFPSGAVSRLGGQRITVRDSAVVLDDGTVAGSVATMDRVFRVLIADVGLSFSDAATLCSMTPARELGMTGFGALTVGAVADLVVLDEELRVIQTYIAGESVYDGRGI
jgi:N-acetylglucosamine-6-phosphate deacetylase